MDSSIDHEVISNAESNDVAEALSATPTPALVPIPEVDVCRSCKLSWEEKQYHNLGLHEEANHEKCLFREILSHGDSKQNPDHEAVGEKGDEEDEEDEGGAIAYPLHVSTLC